MAAVAIGRAHEIGARIGTSLLGALSYSASYARNLRATREWRRLAI